VAGDTLWPPESQAGLEATISPGSGVRASHTQEPECIETRGQPDFGVEFDIGGRMVHPHFIRSLRAFIRRR